MVKQKIQGEFIMDENTQLIHPKQCYLCHTDKGYKYMEQIYDYKVHFFGTWGNFTVLPMIGSGIDGYVLVFHKDHYHSMADMPPKDIKSLWELIDIIKKEMSKSYGPSVVFEHGSTCDNISCLIDHAHIHITPILEGFDIKNEIEEDFELSPLKRFTDLSYWRRGGLGRLQYKINGGEMDEDTARKRYIPFSGYLYYENPSRKMFIHELEDLYVFQPQYLRKVLFKKLGIAEWEWNKNIDPDCQQRTVERLDGLSDYLEPFDNEAFL